MNGMSVCMALWHAGYGPYVFALVVYVALGRVYFAYHWVGDCFGGAVLAVASSLVVAAVKPYGTWNVYENVAVGLIFVLIMKLSSTKRKQHAT